MIKGLSLEVARDSAASKGQQRWGALAQPRCGRGELSPMSGGVAGVNCPQCQRQDRVGGQPRAIGWNAVQEQAWLSPRWPQAPSFLGPPAGPPVCHARSSPDSTGSGADSAGERPAGRTEGVSCCAPL